MTTTTLIRMAPPNDDRSINNTFRALSKMSTPPPGFSLSPNLSSASNTPSSREDDMAVDVGNKSEVLSRPGNSQVVQMERPAGQNVTGERVLRFEHVGRDVSSLSPQKHLQGVETQTSSYRPPSKSPVSLADKQIISSSSIPHLLSNASSGICGASTDVCNKLIPLHHEFSFAGLDAVLPSVDSCNEHWSPYDGGCASGYAIPHDGKYKYTSPPVQPTLYTGRTISPLYLNYQCTTPFSQTSRSSITPPVAVGMTPSSQLLMPPTVEAGQPKAISPPPPLNPITGDTPTRVYHTQSIVQPVLYSAINSLEKYNAGSFDNKIMLARARGRYGSGKAFPGVPIGKTNQLHGKGVRGCSISTETSEAETKASSVLEGDSIGITHNSEDNSMQGGAIPTKLENGMLASNSLKKGSVIIKSRSQESLTDYEANTEAQTARRRSFQPSVTIDQSVKKKNKRREKKVVGVFRPSCDAYTPRMANRAIKYKPAEERTSVEKMSTTMGTIQRPNFRDALRRVAIILHQHITKIEQRFEAGVRGADDTLFKASMRDVFNEELFATPRYRCCMVRVPMARPGVVYSMRKIRVVYTTPTTDEIYDFAHQLFKKVQLSSECSIVCLIYVEKLMEVAKVPLMSDTWRPIFMCGLLLASKVWQDLSSWNIEFASVYPQFSLDAINRLELQFLKLIKWDLYISSSLYAKYYFALRSLLEKSGFRDRYNRMVGGLGGIAASEAMKVSKRSEAVKEEALLQLSRSM